MTTSDLVLVGGGEHARVIADAVRSTTHHRLIGFVDARESSENESRLALRRVGDDRQPTGLGNVKGVLAFGTVESAQLREDAVSRLSPHLGGWAVIQHATAWVSPNAQLGEGTVVLAGAIIQTGAKIGAHCVVNTRAVIEHDVWLGDHVQVSPGAVLGGGVRVGAGTFIGLGAIVRDHITIGTGAIIGMGAVVVKDVPALRRVIGNPAR